MTHIPRIKPLEWEHADNMIYYAVSVVGIFYVSGGRFWLRGCTAASSIEMRDDDTAKAAAQAHYEALIRSTIEDITP